MDKHQKKEDFILFATADWDTPYWTNKQHMAKQFAKFGHRVLYVESIGLRKPKIKSGTDWKRIFFRLLRGLSPPKNVDQHIWVLSPLVLPYSFQHRWVKFFNQFIMTWQIKRFKEKHNFVSPYVWTYHPYIIDIIKRLKFKNKLIYHCVDDLSAVPGISKKSFDSEEKKLLMKANLVFVTSKLLKKKCSKYNKKTYYFPNVVDFEHFSKAQNAGEIPEDLRRIPTPRIVYMGALSEFKIDFYSLLKLVKKLPRHNFIFIGDEIEGQNSITLKNLIKCDNVYCLGFKSYDQLPFYLRGMQVALLPLKVNEYTKSISPMKFFEYIASGIPVAAFNFEFNRLKNKKIIFSNTLNKLIVSVRMLAKGSKLNFKETKTLVGKNTWKHRTELMLRFLHTK
jgi:hypothetical protein